MRVDRFSTLLYRIGGLLTSARPRLTHAGAKVDDVIDLFLETRKSRTRVLRG